MSLRLCPVLFGSLFAAASAVADSLNCRLVGNWPAGDFTTVALDTVRGLAFWGSGVSVFCFDVSDSASPARLSSTVHTAQTICDLAYRPNRLYVAAGVEVWDVTRPAAVRKVVVTR